jgi:hypothetical protein
VMLADFLRERTPQIRPSAYVPSKRSNRRWHEWG